MAISRTIALSCFAVSALVVISAMFGCNGPAPTIETGQTYTVRGILVADYSRPRTMAAVDLRRNNAMRPLSQISIDAQAFLFARPQFPIDSVFSIATTSARTVANGTHRLYLVDSNLLNDSNTITVADSFAITSVDPNTRLLQGLDQATIEWSGSLGAETYVIAAVLRSAAYTGTGYSAYVTSLNTAGTFPPDAFSLSPGPAPDTGWYYLYTYAVSGSPDSVYSRHLLPVPLPSQLPNTIDKTNIGGRFGSVVITRRDSIHVVQQL